MAKFYGIINSCKQHTHAQIWMYNIYHIDYYDNYAYCFEGHWK